MCDCVEKETARLNAAFNGISGAFSNIMEAPVTKEKIVAMPFTSGKKTINIVPRFCPFCGTRISLITPTSKY